MRRSKGKRGIWARWQVNGLIRLCVAFLNRKMTGSTMEGISKKGTASSSLPLPRPQGFLKRLKTLRERSIRPQTWLDWEFSRRRSTNDLCFHSPGDRTYCALWQSFYYSQTGNILFELAGTKTERISSPLNPLCLVLNRKLQSFSFDSFGDRPHVRIIAIAPPFPVVTRFHTWF